jgi:hypothetical protein
VPEFLIRESQVAILAKKCLYVNTLICFVLNCKKLKLQRLHARLSTVKGMISISIIVFSTVFGWIGALLSNGNWFGAASIILSTLGCFVGIWAGYKIGQYLGY